MKDFFRHYFLPHHTNNQRPKLLHHDSLFIVAIFFLAATFLVTSIKTTNPQVLGTSITISTQELLNLTNQERQKNNELPLVMNNALTHAAQLKAQDMFAQNYWAHNSPDGKMPWDFIQNAGYNYQYAGENLARGFTSAQDVVTAWMNSPEHRANMLSPNYHDVGFALREGSLTGEKDTILIVEELGSTPADVPQGNGTNTLGSAALPQPLPPTQIQNHPAVDTRLLTKDIALGTLVLFILIFLIDILIVERKKLVRFVGHNLDHIMFLLTVGTVVLLLQLGAVL
jgi:hypothetical protein